MAAINFPASPSLNDTHTHNGKSWIWNGVHWSINDTSNLQKFWHTLGSTNYGSTSSPQYDYKYYRITSDITYDLNRVYEVLIDADDNSGHVATYHLYISQHASTGNHDRIIMSHVSGKPTQMRVALDSNEHVWIASTQKWGNIRIRGLHENEDVSSMPFADSQLASIPSPQFNQTTPFIWDGDTNTLALMPVSNLNGDFGIGTATPQSELDVVGVIRAGNNTSTGGGTALRVQYNSVGDHTANFGAQYSVGAPMLGYCVESSQSSPDTFVSTADNSGFGRGALVVSHDLEYYSAGGQTTTVGDVVTMTKRLHIDPSGHADIGNFRIEQGGTGSYLEGVSSIAFRNTTDIWASAANHGIMSTDQTGTFTDDISINTYHDLSIRLDSNDNHSDGYLRIYKDTTTSSSSTLSHYFGHNTTGLNVSYMSGNVGINTSPKTDSYRLSMGGHIHMNNFAINYVDQLHFNDGLRFVGEGNDQFLIYKWNDTGTGGIKFVDGDDILHGYVFGDGSGAFGLLSNSGDWGVKLFGNGETQLFYDNAERLNTTSTGVEITGSLEVRTDSSNSALLVNTSGFDDVVIRGSENVGLMIVSKATSLTSSSSEATINFASDVSAGQSIIGPTEFQHGFIKTIIQTASEDASMHLGLKGNEYLSILDGGKVGIGTSSPDSKFVVEDLTLDQLKLVYDSTRSWRLRAGSSGALIIKNSSNSEVMRIDSSGKVGIGTSSPSYELEVDGKIHASDGIHVEDRRNDGDITPVNWPHRSISTFFTDDIAGSPNTWDSGITVSGWDNSTYRVWQLFSNSNTTGGTGVGDLYFRSGVGSNWETLEKVWTDANLTKATTSTLGLVKLGSGIIQTTNPNTPTATASRTYSVQMLSNDQLVVNVPWTDSVGSSLWAESGSNIYYNTGNVGIGTDDPTTDLHFYGKSVFIDGGGKNPSDTALSSYYDTGNLSHPGIIIGNEWAHDQNQKNSAWTKQKFRVISYNGEYLWNSTNSGVYEFDHTSQSWSSSKSYDNPNYASHYTKLRRDKQESQGHLIYAIGTDKDSNSYTGSSTSSGDIFEVYNNGFVRTYGSIMVGSSVSNLGDQAGTIRYNSTTDDFEGRKASKWTSMTQGHVEVIDVTPSDMDTGTDKNLLKVSGTYQIDATHDTTTSSGTFTPSYTTSGTGFSSMTFNSARYGTYSRTGRTIYFTLYIYSWNYTAGSETGYLKITGLPFTSATSHTVARGQVTIGYHRAWKYAPTAGYVMEGTNQIRLFKRN